MKILFCKISCMDYYKGACENDVPYNGGKFVDENGYGNEQYNFDPVVIDNDEYLLGFVETKSTSRGKSNELHIEKINGCDSLNKDNKVENVLVVWCATTNYNETSVVGWYKNATVYRNYQILEFDDGYIQDYNIIAKKEDCVLLPRGERHRSTWNVLTARKNKVGFGHSLIWYAREEKAQNFINKLKNSIEEYDGENWLDM